MRCTDKKLRVLSLVLAGALVAGGCGTKTYELTQAYDVYGTQLHYGQSAEDAVLADGFPKYFAADLCVGEDITAGTDGTNAQVAEAAALFHEPSRTIPYAKNIYKKLYPASTTKILTAYLALKYGKLTDVITVSENAANQASDSSVCNLKAGDQLTLEELLYGLLLKSGNDAAIAIAEYISGSTEQFAALMNDEAAALGATHSHFVNPHGLHDDAHYTCAYDLYLLFRAALTYDKFVDIIHTSRHTPSYYDADGLPVTQQWETTDKFLNGGAKAPDGVTVIGGKTGTTNAAGYCLVLYSKNAAGDPVISIVLKADCRANLYLLMTEILAG